MAVLGLGLGGLLAREAVSAGAPIDDLVLWAAPATGRSFVREMRAFSRLQEGRPDEEADASLPDGWLETGGFVLSAETLQSLRSLDPRVPSSSSLRRALLLDRDGIAPDPGLAAGLEDAGVEVTVAPGEGWGEMVAHPERTKLPLGVVERVLSWLRLAEGQGPAGGGGEREEPTPTSLQRESSAGPAETVLDIDGRGVRESPLLVPQPYGNAFGVLAEPVGQSEAALCVVFLNAGAIRHTGPNRLWVEAARRWASRGVRALRVDLEGIGEADGDDSRRTDVASFYVPDFEEQVEVVLDFLQERGLGGRFLLVGLCAGGYWSFRVALRDTRVGVALLLNAGALSWHDNLLSEREAGKLDRVFQQHWWRQLLRGQVRPARLWAFVRLSLAKVGWEVRRLADHLPGRSGISAASGLEANLDQLRNSGVRAVLAFSDGEPLHTELNTKGILDRLERWPNLALESLPGDDHTLRSAAAQLAAHELIDHEVERTSEVQPHGAGGG